MFLIVTHVDTVTKRKIIDSLSVSESRVLAFWLTQSYA